MKHSSTTPPQHGPGSVAATDSHSRAEVALGGVAAHASREEDRAGLLGVAEEPTASSGDKVLAGILTIDRLPVRGTIGGTPSG